MIADFCDNLSNAIQSCDVTCRVKIKIGSLEGKIKRPAFEELIEDPMLKFSGVCQNQSYSEMKVDVAIFSNGKSISLPVSTSFKSFSCRRNWNEWVILPLRFCDLPRNAQICMTVYDCGGSSKLLPIGGTTIKIFGKNGIFRQGMLDLRVWPGQEADGNDPTSTPGKGPKGNRMYRLTKLAKKHRIGQISKVDWLDRLTFREIETICEKDKRDSDFFYLNVQFPVAEYAGVQYGIMYNESGDTAVPIQSTKALREFSWLPDHEILLDNPVEKKHHTLSRLSGGGDWDGNLKPAPAVRDQLNIIVSYPSSKPLTAEEQDLIWKYRFYLSSNKKALAKFLKCVKWEISGEEKQALELLNKWTPMDVEDALELLGPQFTHPGVRRYAVARLQQAPDEDLLLYLLQLVQALKYENINTIQQTGQSQSHHFKKLKEDSSISKTIHSKEIISPVSSGNDFSSIKNNINIGEPALVSFLIKRACSNNVLSNYFYWYLYIECEDQDVGVKQEKHIRDLYLKIMERFLFSLKNGNPEWKERKHILSRQQEFISNLVEVVKTVAKESANRQKKLEKLQSLLNDEESTKPYFSAIDPLPFPLDPDVVITGVIAKESILFKSSLMPCALSFKTTKGKTYVAIFKHGDDLRQDQLILQIITLMDKLLRKENLDLKLSPYRVLATSTTHGLVQFIKSTTVAEVLHKYTTIQDFFQKHNSQEMYETAVMDNYVRSCAGYCVITYLLGVGDRHLDNLLLTEDGRLFHIDFGYILGRDPKLMPPPMKLSKEMIDAMGGLQSEYYKEFMKLCYTAYLHLRRHANLILNLFSLMVGASVPDIALEPEKTVKKVQDKFRLELDDEAAVQHMQELINVSASALMPAIVEQMHKFTQMLRK